MSLPFHLVPSLKHASVGSVVAVDGAEAHHAVAVRRLRVGERVALTDGAGTTIEGPVESTSKRAFTVLVEQRHNVAPPAPELVVIQALPKGDRGELAVEMLTEIGTARIVPWAAARSVAVWKGERAAKSLAKWQSTAREAAKQARRSWHPEVSELHGTPEALDLALELTQAGALVVVLHEDAEAGFAELTVPAEGTIVLVVGPEGGLTSEEVEAFVQAGGTALRLGAEVLRTSTAGVAAGAALLARTPRWG